MVAWNLGGLVRASRECEFAGPQDLPGVTGPGAELTLRSEGMGWGPAALLDCALWLRGLTRSSRDRGFLLGLEERKNRQSTLF